MKNSLSGKCVCRKDPEERHPDGDDKDRPQQDDFLCIFVALHAQVVNVAGQGKQIARPDHEGQGQCKITTKPRSNGDWQGMNDCAGV